MKTLNKLKLFMIAFIAIISIGTTSAQCTASFTTVDNGGGNYTFTSTSVGGQSMWWEIDNSYSGGASSLTNTFINGTYTVCLTIEDSVAGCLDQTCQTIVVTSGVSCNVTAGFTAIDNGNGNYSFTNTSTGSGLNYFWNLGDGTTSGTMSPNHTYTSNGVYIVELSVIDSNSCHDYYYTTIQVTGVASSTLCNVAFVIIPDSSQQGPGSGNILVFNTSTGNNLTYFWDFGDGNTSTQQYPTYVYSTAGPFLLCLTVDNGSGCTSTYCDSIGSNGIVFRQAGFAISVQAPVVTSIETQVETFSDITLYPNPVKNNLTISLNLNEANNVEVFVTDMLGNLVGLIANQQMNSGNNQLRWSTNNVPNGIYLLNIKTANSLEVKKLIVNK